MLDSASLVVRAAATVAVAAVLSASCDDRSTAPGTPTATASGTTSSGVGAAGGGGAGASGAAGGAAGAGGLDTCGLGLPPIGGGSADPSRLRVVAANLTSGNHQSYDGGHGIRILQGLDADVVLMQEMNYRSSSPDDIGELVDQVCDGRCRYVRGPPAEIPNGVLSRLPFLECGSWPDPQVDNRDFVWARLDVPGSVDLWAISVHLLSSNPTDRVAQVNGLLGYIAAAIPPGDLIVLGGDLNTTSRTEETLTTLAAVFDTAGPYPADHQDNGMTNAPRNEPYDWVLTNAALATQQSQVQIGQSLFPAGAVIDTRVYVPLAEIAPAQQDDSAAAGMQHMAVVKDFQLQH